MNRLRATSRSKTTAASKPSADRYVQLVVVALMAFGVVAVYSAVSFLAETKAGGEPERLLLRHLVRVLLAAGAIVVSVAHGLSAAGPLDASRWLAGIAGTVVAGAGWAGVAFGGATRWLRIGSLAFQPSDLAGVALLLHLSVLLTRKQGYIHSFDRGFLPLLFWILMTAVLIGIENLSTAALLTASMLLLCFVGGCGCCTWPARGCSGCCWLR